MDAVIRTGNERHAAKWLDLLMLVLFAGRERDEEQWRELLGSAEFEPVQIRDGLIEARCRCPSGTTGTLRGSQDSTQ